eukprot:m.87107 g.87107  ORF g.87107 m.87107 type:complete len:400 (-) comp16394_c0_seq1:271-1470(-)
MNEQIFCAAAEPEPGEQNEVCLCGTEADVVLVVLIGIPGSGKTTFAQAIERKFANFCTCSSCCVDTEVVSFDDFVFDPNIHSSRATRFAPGLSMSFVLETAEHANTTEHHLLQETSSGDSKVAHPEYDEAIDDCNMRAQRERVLGRIASKVASSFKPSTEKRCKRILIIDDNMFYTSMRYQVYQIARRMSAGFVQVHMDCPVDVAVERDATRTSHRIGSEGIRRMYERMELPKPAVHGWEKHSISQPHTYTFSHPSGDGATTKSMEPPPMQAESVSVADPAHPMHHVWRMIDAAFRTPAIPLQTPQDQAIRLAKARETTAKSVLHAFDTGSRKLLSTALKQRTTTETKNGAVKDMAKQMNGLRKQALADASRRLKSADTASVNVDTLLAELEQALNTVV